ncbi:MULTISPECIES: FMN-binding negative transcriptional regulator [Microbacterium]|uniref:Transcriptional regulator n=1 Tax=Microbacterium hominis TaxID=162426 RepID=A0A2K9DJN6_9MICO|nr:MULTISPECIES: FMN-binding negative transcriptional regulator [Microbacterium]AUG29717.1 transcriptional regulator [Microbacterium hominis]
MRQNPSFAMTDVGELRRILELNPWMTLVSASDGGLVASHYAVLLDEERDDLTVVGHVGKPDDAVHGLGERELLIVAQGPHGYISPGWYPPGPNVPTWNYVAVHLSGIPEILTPEENLRVLDRLVARFESGLPQPRLMWQPPNDEEYVRRLERGTVGFRLTPTRVVAKRKLSQNRPDETVDEIVVQLEAGNSPYADQRLAGEMRRAHAAIRAGRAAQLRQNTAADAAATPRSAAEEEL